jgi:hypothetical protein
LPVASAFEREALKIGFEISEEASDGRFRPFSTRNSAGARRVSSGRRYTS